MLSFAGGIVAIIVLSVPPGSEVPSVGLSDKIQHAAAYLAVMVLGGIVFRGGRSRRLVALALIGLGIGLEGIQAYLPTRQGGVDDAIANTVGVVLGLVIVSSLPPRWRFFDA